MTNKSTAAVEHWFYSTIARAWELEMCGMPEAAEALRKMADAAPLRVEIHRPKKPGRRPGRSWKVNRRRDPVSRMKPRREKYGHIKRVGCRYDRHQHRWVSQLVRVRR